MLFHYTVKFCQPGGTPITISITDRPAVTVPYGWLGVDLFFIISGFVIFMTLERAPTITAFAIARIARLLPAFLVCLLLTAGIYAIVGDPVSAGVLLANATMMPEWLGFPAIDPAYWTLKWEIAFYAIAARTLRDRAPELPCAIFLGVQAIGMVLTNHPSDGRAFGLLFIIGIMIHRIHTRRSVAITYGVLAGCVILALCGAGDGRGDIPRIVYAQRLAAWYGWRSRRLARRGRSPRFGSSGASPTRSICCIRFPAPC
jgi:peptidoglycan/LPS O-acetylase OafA/YrhL